MAKYVPNKIQNIDKQTGTSLMEVLVTVIITAIGLLGLAIIQNTGLKASYDSYARTQGSFLAADLADRVRANPTATEYTLAADSDPPAEPPCFAANADCSVEDIRNFDLFHWRQSAVAALPQAMASVTFDNANNLYTVTLSWEDRIVNDEVAGDADDFKALNYHFKVTN